MRNSPILRIQDFLNSKGRQAILPGLVQSIDVGPDLRLLDIGGGTGAAAELFASECREVVVLEPDPRKVEYGRAHHERLQFVEGSAENIPFPDEHFDRAVALVSFHHVRDQAKALQEIYRVLKPGGKLVFHEFDPSSPRGKISRFIENDVLGHGCTFLEPMRLKEVVERHGFRDVSFGPNAMGYLLTSAK